MYVFDFTINNNIHNNKSSYVDFWLLCVIGSIIVGFLNIDHEV
jgi:hypothetical protein